MLQEIKCFGNIYEKRIFVQGVDAVCGLFWTEPQGSVLRVEGGSPAQRTGACASSYWVLPDAEDAVFSSGAATALRGRLQERRK